MAGRASTTFKKRQREQQQKDRREEKLARRLQRNRETKPEEDRNIPAESGLGEMPSAEGV